MNIKVDLLWLPGMDEVAQSIWRSGAINDALDQLNEMGYIPDDVSNIVVTMHTETDETAFCDLECDGEQTRNGERAVGFSLSRSNQNIVGGR